MDGQERTGYLILFGYRFIQGSRISDDEQRPITRIHHLANGSCPLDTEGGFVIAPFHGTAAVRQEKYAITFHQIIQICTAVFSRFPGGKDDEMGSFFRNLGEDEPTGRQK